MAPASATTNSRLQSVSESSPRPNLMMDRIVAPEVTMIGQRIPAFYSDIVFSIIIDQSTTLLNAPDALLAIEDTLHNAMQVKAARGNWVAHVGTLLHPSTGVSMQSFASGQPFIWNTRQARSEWFTTHTATQTVVCVPLMTRTGLIGVLWIGRDLPFTSQELQLLATLIRTTTQAIAPFATSDTQIDPGYQAGQTCEAVVDIWSSLLALRDSGTDSHSQQTTRMLMRLARRMYISEADLLHARRGALLHDIGKLAIPDSILFKPGALTSEEWAIMRQHPSYGYQMLSAIPCLVPALDIPYAHHERWDGTGYPRGLAGTAIPLTARIFAVIDVWEALRSDRPYRKAWPETQVRTYIHNQSGTHFDPDVVQKFLELLHEDDQLIARLSF